MRFFILEPVGGIRFGTKWAYAEKVEPVLLGEARVCPICDQAISLLEWLPPHRIKLSSAKPEKWGDFLWGGTFLAVSERLKDIYHAEGLSGIEYFYPPAEIVRVGTRKARDLPKSLPVYSAVSIKWNGANLDDEISGVVRKPGKSVCRFHRGWIQSLERIGLETVSWDGSDIFIARGGLNSATVVSERFRDAIEKHSLTNAWLIPAENYAYREIGGWYVRDSNESDETTLTSLGKRQPPKTG